MEKDSSKRNIKQTYDIPVFVHIIWPREWETVYEICRQWVNH